MTVYMSAQVDILHFSIRCPLFLLEYLYFFPTLLACQKDITQMKN